MSDLSTTLIAAATKAAEDANAIVDRVAASRQSVSGKVVSNMRDTVEISELPEAIRDAIAKYRANLEKIDATRAKLVQVHTDLVKEHQPQDSDALSDEQVAALKAQYTELRGVHRNAVKFAKTLSALSPEDEAALPSLKNFGGGTSTSTGTGGRKPRFDSIVVNGEEIFEEKDGKKVVTLTVLAGWMNDAHKSDKDFTKVTTAELFEHLSAEAKTDDLSEVTDVSLGKFRGEYNVTVYPRQATAAETATDAA